MSAKCCSACGQALPEFGGIVADDMRGEIRFRGRRALGFTSREFQLFRCLLDAKGRTKSKGEILDFLYQLDPDDEPEIKIIDVFVCKLRKKLEPLGLSIGTAWGRGYFLAEPAPGPVTPGTAANTAATTAPAPAQSSNISNLDGIGKHMRNVSGAESGQKEGV